MAIPEYSLSIIIPTLNEEKNLSRLLSSLPIQRENVEVFICDGGSTDATQEIAEQFSVQFIKSPRGRGQQINAGIEHACGNLFWFLHADSVVNVEHVDAIFDCFQHHSDVLGGNFSILFDGNDEFSHWLNKFYKMIRARGIYYGDSGIFIRRAVLEMMGGMPERYLMEDYALVRLMQTFKHRKLANVPTINTFCIESPQIQTSSRRFVGRARWRIVLGWLVIHALYHLGVPDQLLASLYDSGRNRQKC